MPTKQEFDSALDSVCRRAATDDSYRKLCLTDAAAAYQAASGANPPVKLRFVENRDQEVTIVLPNKMNAAGEISDEALAQVAGGVGEGLYRGCDRTCDASGGTAALPYCMR